MSSQRSIEEELKKGIAQSQLSSTPASSSFGAGTFPSATSGLTKAFGKGFDKEEQTSDSGFLSGPLSEDSGLICIDDSDDHLPSSPKVLLPDKHKQNQKESSATTPTITTTATDDKNIVDNEYLDSGCIDASDYSLDALKPSDTADHMISDSGIDSTLSDKFYKLSLSNQHRQHLKQIELSSNSKDSAFVDDLSSSCHTSSASAQLSASVCATPAAETAANIANNGSPWEIYYQQNKDGDTYLHLAVINGRADVVFTLISLTPHPCLLDIQNDEHQAALHLAVLTSQMDIVQGLLVAGAKATIRDRCGNTPLHIASMYGDLEMVKVLTSPVPTISSSTTGFSSSNKFENKILNSMLVQNRFSSQMAQDLEQRNYDGELCVHLAAQGNHIDVLRHLVNLGADINAREGKSGKTPLHIAIENSNEELANFILAECEKLDLEAVTYAGLTAYQFAILGRNQRLLTDLTKYGAEQLSLSSDNDSDSEYDYEFDDNKTHFGDPRFFPSFNAGNAINVA